MGSLEKKMTLSARLNIFLLLLGITSLSLVHAVPLAGESQGEGNPETAEGLKDIQERLLNLETMLIKQHELIDSRLKSLQIKLDTLTAKGQESDVEKELLTAIYGGKFKWVETKLAELGDKAPIAGVVHEVYYGSECNFGTLIKLTQAMSKPSLKYQMLMAIYAEVKSDNYKDVQNLIMLAKELESEILQKIDFPEAENVKVSEAIEQLREAIASEASKIFIAAMKSDKNYKYNETVVAIGADLDSYRSSVAADVINRTVQGAFYAIDFSALLDKVNSHASLWQRIAGMDAIKDQLHKAEVVSDYLDLHMASYLKEILDQTEYAFLDPVMHATAEALVAKLPANIRNLFFLSNFCIYSKLRDSYLIASTSLYDSERRNVLIAPRSKAGDLPAGASWRVKLINNQLFFDNIDFPGENIYAALIDYAKNIHYVFGWLPGNNTDPQSAWTIQTDCDSLLLRNVYFNEFLYASETQNIVAGNKYVFSLKKQHTQERLGLRWQITDC